MREFDLLKHIYTANRQLPPGVTIPPGDDMGAVRIGGGEVLVTVDQIADGLHFDLAKTPLEKIARKAITRNLSDVAAMAALPVAAVAAACLPRDFGADRANELFDHMRRTAEFYQCPLIGGDISMWDHPLLLSVTVLAEPAGIEPVRRSGAKVGDAVCVTGRLGGSLIEHAGHVHHLDFEPRIKLARILAGVAATRPHCMIDLSDGLARDLGHLCAAAGVGAEIWEARLPISHAVRSAADGQPAWRHVLGDGEDYELCFTLPAERAKALPDKIDDCPISVIGRVVAKPAGSADTSLITLIHADGLAEPVGDLGWEHRGS